MSGETRLGPGGEFDAIREIVKRLGSAAGGIGDDAAMLDVPRGDRLVVSTDASIEGRHFKPDWLTAREIGYRAVTAALSDLAAMAAHPIALLWAVNLPDRWRPMLSEIADGVGEAARQVNAKVVGGNLAASSELSIVTTVIGSVFRPLERKGAAPGEKLYVSGRLGGPMSALTAWVNGKVPDPGHRERFARPAARVAEARWLAEHGATAGLDISDGIAGDARHLAAASGVGLRIDLDRLPRMERVEPLAAAISGEEYELLVAAPALDAGKFETRFGIPLTEIGEVVAGSSVAFFNRGRPMDLGGGHDHFRVST
jgi:thiamine-monophosphate kinase